MKHKYKLMKKLHQDLMGKKKWYASWHKDPSHYFIQIMVLALVIGGVSGLLYYRFNQEAGNSYGLQTKAASQRAAQLETQMPSLTRDLLNKAHQLRGANPETRAQLLSELTTIAKTRHDVMKQALQDNPGAIVRNAISIPGLRQQLPPEVNAYLEKPVTTDGTFEWRVEMPIHEHEMNETGKPDPDMLPKHSFFLVDSSGSRKEMHLSKIPDRTIVTGSKVRVKGYEIDNELAADGTDTGAIQVIQAAALATTGVHRMAVIMINFADNPVQTFTADQVRTSLFTGTQSANNYYKEASYGLTSLTGYTRPDGDVYGWYTINSQSSDCNTSSGISSIAQKAQHTAAAAGFSASNYENIMYAFPLTSACGQYAGIGEIGGNETWINGYVTNTRTVVHELGHNYGLYHSRNLDCGATVVGSNCTTTEYGHYADIMGYNGVSGHFHPYQKTRLGWLNTPGTPPITTVTTSGAYAIAPVAAPNSGVSRGLKIRKSTGESYFVEYRQRIGFDTGIANYSGGNLTTGVILTQDNDTNGQLNYQLDMTPETTVWSDSALAVGKSYTDSAAGVTITTLAADASGATVQVTFGNDPAPCTAFPPSLSITPTAQSGMAGSTLGYNFTLQNNDTNTCAASTYTITSTVPAGWYTSGSFTESLAPGASVTRTVNITSSATATGTNTFTLVAANTANNGLTKSASATFSITTPPPPPPTADTTAPVVVITAPANGSTLPVKGTFKITTTANDDSGIATLTIKFDGATLKTCSLVTACSVNAPKNIAAGPHIITATATDNSAAHNAATPVSITVTK